MGGRDPGTDAELVVRFADGDVDAFAWLFRRHQHDVLAFMVRMTGTRADAEDLAQETFVRVFQSLPDLQQPSRFRSWLGSIAANLCRDHHRSLRPRRHVSIERDLDVERELADPAAGGDPEVARRVRRALEALDEDRRLVVVLREYHGLSHREIAHIAACPEGTVRWRLHSARRQMQHDLSDLLE